VATVGADMSMYRYRSRYAYIRFSLYNTTCIIWLNVLSFVLLAVPGDYGQRVEAEWASSIHSEQWAQRP